MYQHSIVMHYYYFLPLGVKTPDLKTKFKTDKNAGKAIEVRLAVG